MADVKKERLKYAVLSTRSSKAVCANLLEPIAAIFYQRLLHLPRLDSFLRP